jgi:UPF0716 family protein affecting phage T7 exclusion
MIKHTPTNPLANLLIIAAGIVVIGVTVVAGFFAFVVLAAVVSVAAAVLGIRVWWFNRKLGRQSAPKAGASRARTTAGVIEGEYKVVDKDRDEA